MKKRETTYKRSDKGKSLLQHRKRRGEKRGLIRKVSRERMGDISGKRKKRQ